MSMHEYGCVPCVNPLYTTLFQEVPSTWSNKSMALTALFRRLPTLSQAPVRTRSGLAGGAGGTNLSCISSIGCDTCRKEAAGSHVALEQPYCGLRQVVVVTCSSQGKQETACCYLPEITGARLAELPAFQARTCCAFHTEPQKTGATKARGDPHLQGQLLQPCHLAQWCQIQE